VDGLCVALVDFGYYLYLVFLCISRLTRSVSLVGVCHIFIPSIKTQLCPSESPVLLVITKRILF